MKILHIIDSGGLYGAEVMLLNLMNEQTVLGHETVLASIGEKGVTEKPVEAEASRRGLTVTRFRMRPGPNVRGALEILRFARDGGFQIMHSHGYKADILFGFLPGRVRGLPIVTTLHGWTCGGGLSMLRLYEWLDAQSLRFIDAVVLVSESMLSHPRLRHFDRAGVHVIHNGVPVPGANGGPPSAAGDSDLDSAITEFCASGFTVGSIGRLSPEKGYPRLIGAVRLLAESEPDIRLVIIGEGPQRRELEREVRRLGIGPRVFMPGYRSEAGKYMKFFSVFVISSFSEGLPMSLLEAMRAGTPIVSTRVGGIPDALGSGRAGILVDSPESADLAACISRLKHDPALGARLTVNAESIVDRCYSSRAMALKYDGIYSSLVN